MRATRVVRQARTIAAALLLATGVAGCSRGDDYPHDWPALAHSWGCPKLTGQWRLGGQPGLALGILGDVASFRVMGETPVAWEAVAISPDAEGRLRIRLVRAAAQQADPLAAVPSELRRYVEDTPASSSERVLTQDERVTHYEAGLGRDHSPCFGSKESIGPVVAGGADDMFLGVDREGNLVAERQQIHADSIRLNAESPAISLGHSTDHRWARWPPMTSAEFDAVESRARAAGAVFDLGPVHQGTIGRQDVDLLRQEATAELEAGAKVVAMHPAGAGTVLATIEAIDLPGIRRALDRMSDARVFEFALRRYDPTHSGAIQADVLFARRDSAIGKTQSQGMQIGEAQAAVLATMPDSVVYKNLVPSPRGFLLRAHAENREGIARLIRTMAASGRFAVHPESPDRVALGVDGSFALEITPRK